MITVVADITAIGSTRRRAIPMRSSHADGTASVMASAPTEEPVSARMIT
jgi:hypothetical protein